MADSRLIDCSFLSDLYVFLRRFQWEKRAKRKWCTLTDWWVFLFNAKMRRSNHDHRFDRFKRFISCNCKHTHTHCTRLISSHSTISPTDCKHKMCVCVHLALARIESNWMRAFIICTHEINCRLHSIRCNLFGCRWFIYARLHCV